MVENRVRRQKGLFDLAVAVKATHDFALALEDSSNNDTLHPKYDLIIRPISAHPTEFSSY
jgi:hypothetical protein